MQSQRIAMETVSGSAVHLLVVYDDRLGDSAYRLRVPVPGALPDV
jgi:hypothetical protein